MQDGTEVQGRPCTPVLSSTEDRLRNREHTGNRGHRSWAHGFPTRQLQGLESGTGGPPSHSRDKALAGFTPHAGGLSTYAAYVLTAGPRWCPGHTRRHHRPEVGPVGSSCTSNVSVRGTPLPLPMPLPTTPVTPPMLSGQRTAAWLYGSHR